MNKKMQEDKSDAEASKGNDLYNPFTGLSIKNKSELKLEADKVLKNAESAVDNMMIYLVMLLLVNPIIGWCIFLKKCRLVHAKRSLLKHLRIVSAESVDWSKPNTLY